MNRRTESEQRRRLDAQRQQREDLQLQVSMKQARQVREKEAAAAGERGDPYWLTGPSNGQRPRDDGARALAEEYGVGMPQQGGYGVPGARPGSRGQIRLMPQAGGANPAPRQPQASRRPPSAEHGMFRGRNDELSEKQKRAAAQQAYMRELEEQMRAREQRKAQERANEDAFNLRFEAEAAQFNALGQRKEREGAELERARKVAAGGSVHLSAAEAAALRREEYVEEFHMFQASRHAQAGRQGRGGPPGEDPGAAAMRALGVVHPGGGGGGGQMSVGGRVGARLFLPPTRVTVPIDDAPLTMLGGAPESQLARRVHSAGAHGPVIRGLDQEAHFSRLLDWERDRARERETERERDKDRERERAERRQGAQRDSDDRQRAWDQRLREEEAERHAKSERLMADEIATLRREVLDQHRRLASQVEEQITRLRQLEPVYRGYLPMRQPAPPSGTSGSASLPPTGSGGSAGYAGMIPNTAGRGGSGSDGSYVASAPYPAYAVPQLQPSLGGPPPGADAYEAAAREAMGERAAGGGAGLPVSAPPGFRQPLSSAPPYVVAGAPSGDELDKLLLEFLANGADLRGS
jgi:hypothetical protein